MGADGAGGVGFENQHDGHGSNSQSLDAASNAAFESDLVRSSLSRRSQLHLSRSTISRLAESLEMLMKAVPGIFGKMIDEAQGAALHAAYLRANGSGWRSHRSHRPPKKNARRAPHRTTISYSLPPPRLDEPLRVDWRALSLDRAKKAGLSSAEEHSSHRAAMATAGVAGRVLMSGSLTRQE